MSQIESLRRGQANHEERLQKLESFLNPIIAEKEAYDSNRSAAENLLDEETPNKPEADATPPPPQAPTPETNPEGGMGIVVSDNGQQPSVSEEGTEEPKDEAN